MFSSPSAPPRSARLIWIVAALLAVCAPPSVSAQDFPAQVPPAHIEVVEGQATLDRDGDRLVADLGMPIVAGDRVSTGRGRVEILFPDGTALDLDEFSDVTCESSSLVRMHGGRVRMTVPTGADARFQIDTPTASAHIAGPGQYRLAIMGSTTYGQTELAVMQGYAELEGDRGSVKLRSGERSVAWPNDVPSRPESFSAAREDAFDRWVMAQHEDRGGRSAQYLPPDLRVYGSTFDQYGSWASEGSYGYVWYPAVAPEWRPYYSGYWTSIGPYGWTWIGAERWAWPTHHFGRWGYARSRWFWIPDRRWAPAWVSWGAAPGYVGWSPLGIDNRPIFGFSASLTFGSGWTVLPRERFGSYRAYANRFAITPRASLPHGPALFESRPPAAPARQPVRRFDTGDRPARDRAVPRYGPQDRGVPSARPPGSGPAATDRVPSARPPESQTGTPPVRQYPFGDFRRRDSADPNPAPPPGAGAVDSARPPRAPAREAAPRERPQDPAPPAPPSAGAGRHSRDDDPARSGTAVGRSRPAESPRSGDSQRGSSQRGGSIHGQQPAQGQGGRSEGRAGARGPR